MAASERWLRWAVASVWMLTGALVVFPGYRDVGAVYLARLGLPVWLMYAACAFELALATRLFVAPAGRWLTWLQIALIAGFSVILAALEPLLLAHPFGALTKNVPMVTLIVALFRVREHGWTKSTEWIVRVGLASIWITEGLFPKIVFQQAIELDVVRRSGIVPVDASAFLVALGAAQVASGLALLVLRSRWLALVLAVQFVSLIILPVTVGALLPELWIHPFGPLTKNIPILAGTAVLLLRSAPFLSAQWSNVALVTFAVPPERLDGRVPAGTQLEVFEGRALLSFVSLDFSRTRVLGIPVPGFRRFPDVNLRFYVSRGGDRGAVFVRELVPKRMVVAAARLLFCEPFARAHIDSRVARDGDHLRIERSINRSHRLLLTAVGPPAPPDRDTERLIERGWGFGTSRSGDTLDYRVVHPAWQTYRVETWELDVDWAALYGPEWEFLGDLEPASVCLAHGSTTSVWFPT